MFGDALAYNWSHFWYLGSFCCCAIIFWPSLVLKSASSTFHAKHCFMAKGEEGQDWYPDMPNGTMAKEDMLEAAAHAREYKYSPTVTWGSGRVVCDGGRRWVNLWEISHKDELKVTWNLSPRSSTICRNPHLSGNSHSSTTLRPSHSRTCSSKLT